MIGGGGIAYSRRLIGNPYGTGYWQPLLLPAIYGIITPPICVKLSHCDPFHRCSHVTEDVSQVIPLLSHVIVHTCDMGHQPKGVANKPQEPSYHGGAKCKMISSIDWSHFHFRKRRWEGTLMPANLSILLNNKHCFCIIMTSSQIRDTFLCQSWLKVKVAKWCWKKRNWQILVCSCF